MSIPYKNTLKPIKTENKCGLLYWDNLFDSFNTKRIFYLSDCQNLNENNKTRGKHINYDCNEILVLLKGKIKIFISKDKKKYNYTCDSNDYVFLPKNYYLEIEILDKDTIYFVLCDNVR